MFIISNWTSFSALVAESCSEIGKMGDSQLVSIMRVVVGATT